MQAKCRSLCTLYSAVSTLCLPCAYKLVNVVISVAFCTAVYILHSVFCSLHLDCTLQSVVCRVCRVQTVQTALFQSVCSLHSALCTLHSATPQSQKSADEAAAKAQPRLINTSLLYKCLCTVKEVTNVVRTLVTRW